MKKLLSLVLIAILALSALSLTACSGEIEQGSKIERVLITLDFYDAENKVVDTKTVQAKLYLNFAPETCARFLSLAEDGYFDGTCVSNVQSGWFEFGGYTFENGTLTKKAFDENKYPALKGEFEKNGWVGNKLTTKSGSLIFKHDTESVNGVSKYDTAKGTIIVALSTLSKFPASEYCVFGTICNDDADDNPYSAVDSSLVNRSGKSSVAVLNTLTDLVSDDGVRTYYYEKENVFYTRVTDDDGVRYYLGTEIGGDALEGEELEKIEDLVSDSDDALLTVPYTKVVIKSVKKK